MATTDTSFYPTQQPQPLNPLDVYGQVQGIQHLQNENTLQQQMIRGRIATGKILAQAQNPDGSTNTNQAMNLIMQDPDARVFAMQTQQDLQNNNRLINYTAQNPQTGAFEQKQAPLPQVMGMGSPGQQAHPPIDQSKVDAAHRHLDGISKVLAPIASNPNATQDDAIGAITDLVSDDGVNYTPQDGAKSLMSLPAGPNGGPPSPQQIQQYAQQKLNQVNQIKAQLPPPSQQQLQGAGPGSLTAPPMGMPQAVASAQENVKKVNDEATAASQTLPVLNNILNLSKGGAKTGTAVPKVYQYLVEKGIAPAGVTDSASQTQLISKYMNQVITGLNPGSDARLQAFEESNPNPTQLPQTIQAVVPFLKAVATGKIAKQGYYNKNVGVGLDPQKEQQANQSWNQSFDPRLLEMRDLQNDPVELQKYVSGLQKTDKDQLLAKYLQAKKLGILNNGQ